MAEATSNTVSRGTQVATVDGLSPATMYKCYAVAENTFGSVCSSFVAITTEANDPVPPEPEGTFYIGPSGDDNNPGTIGSPVATFSKAQELVETARGVGSTDPYRIVFLQGTYDITTQISVTESYIEITSESESSTDTTILEFTGLSIGVSISATTSNVYLHHLTLKQMDFTGVGVLISMGRSPGFGNQIITDWSKSISIYQNVIEVFKYGKFKEDPALSTP